MLFWWLQIGGWGGYTLAAYLEALAHEKPDAYTLVILATAASGALMTIMLRYVYHALEKCSMRVLAVSAIIICYATALGWRLFSNLMYWEIIKHGYRPSHNYDYFGGSVGSFYVLMCWSGLYFGIKYYQQLQQQTEATLKATASAHQAQLKMLRYQLNPHFLFNTLNAISTLILDKRNDTANLAVTKLSEFLRYSLDNDPMKHVPLSQELDALDLYLRIEQLRFSERLQLTYRVEPQARQALVPSLLLQPLIENAIKYAIAPREEGGSIAISARVRGQWLHMSVADDGPGLGGDADGSGCGVGLRNTRQRLAELYGDQHALRLSPVQPHGLNVQIELPLQLRQDT